MKYYDRQGNEISSDEFVRLLGDPEYKAVYQDHFPGWFVSTVWLGLDHNYLHEGSPLIFETMIFPMDENDDSSWFEEYSDRYSTEEEAIEGHLKALQWLYDHV